MLNHSYYYYEKKYYSRKLKIRKLNGKNEQLKKNSKPKKKITLANISQRPFFTHV